jgi:hypothetical protein
MKIFIFLILTISLWACTGQEMEMQQAKKTAETAINLIGKEKFDELASYYSEDFSKSEPIPDRNKKLSLIIETTGPNQNFELLDSIIENNIGEESKITLKYKVNHTNVPTFETYKIGFEAGKYVITGIDIQISN